MAMGNGFKGVSHSTQERKLQDYIAIVLRGKWVIGGVLLASLAVTFLFNKLVDPVYKATAQVLINTRELQSSLFLDQVRPDGIKNITQNELAVLNSRSLSDTVARRLLAIRYLDPDHRRMLPVIHYGKPGQYPDSTAPLAQVSGALSEAVDFDPVRESDIITISAKSKDPLEAAMMANTFAEAYRDRNIFLSRVKSRSFREFLDQQASEKRRELEQTEQGLQSYMEQQGIVSLDEESKNVIEKLSQLEANRDAANIQLHELEKQLSTYQEQLPQQETNVARVMSEANDPYIKLLQEQIAKLEVQRDVTVAQNPSSVGREILNEKVREIDAQIAALTGKLQKRTDAFLRNLTPSQSGEGQDAAGYLKSVKQKIIETQVQVQSLQAKKRALEDVIRQYESQFDRIPRKSLELARRQRARQSDEKLYLLLQEKFNEANITEQSNIGYVEIIEPAGVPVRPASPKELINLLIGGVLGIGLGLVVVFVREYVDVRIQSPEDLKRRGYNTITAVVAMDTDIERLGGKVKDHAGKKGLDAHLIMHSFPFSSVAEAYRQLRTNLQFGKSNEALRVLMVTSAMPGEGKSTTVANLAIAFAQSGKRILLVDADLRKPTVDQLFGVRREPGLSDLLANKVTVTGAILPTAVENLSVLPCGVIPPNPSEILGSRQMQQVVSQLKEMFDVILLDSSPVMAVTDPAILSTLADGVVLVVSAGATRLQALEQSQETLHGVGAKVLGVVVNNVDLKKAYGIDYRRTKSSHYGYQAASYSRADGPQSNGNGQDSKTPAA